MAELIDRKGKQYLREKDGTEWEYSGPGRPSPPQSSPNKVAPEEQTALADLAEAVVALYEELQTLKGGLKRG
ncbi:hypothetical protein GJ688_02510 [Heliobacillus mobilis]|uniref:Uncharacterized protein n=1 Tax=Heliobacterium mobile TaxID=28064 RepID=A0A6I3SFR1_HELMO|nr:hypothetical protein [Heliobacterium mobile]MTV47856.1 hypothetical protein [Heliobacterium mobile]